MEKTEFDKLKIGDTVKIVKHNNHADNEIGDIGTVTEINESNCRVSVKGRPTEFINRCNLHYYECLELIPEETEKEEENEACLFAEWIGERKYTKHQGGNNWFDPEYDYSPVGTTKELFNLFKQRK